MLILFEGVDGSGKSTLARAFTDEMSAMQKTVDTFAFPSKGPVGTLVRQAFRNEIAISPLAYQHLLVADALDYEDRVRESVKHNDIVVLDRHPTISGIVYQVETYSLQTVLQVNTPHMFTPPNLVVLVDIPAEIAVARIHVRGGADSGYEMASVNDVSLRRSRYMAAMTMLPHRYMVIDGQAPTQKNVARVWDTVKRLTLRRN